eukprot:3137112-Pyramimonas_sp.AAC.1
MTLHRLPCGAEFVLLRNYHEWIYPMVRVFHLVFYTLMNVVTGRRARLGSPQACPPPTGTGKTIRERAGI